jgi:hypothetical protein
MRAPSSQRAAAIKQSKQLGWLRKYYMFKLGKYGERLRVAPRKLFIIKLLLTAGREKLQQLSGEQGNCSLRDFYAQVRKQNNFQPLQQ